MKVVCIQEGLAEPTCVPVKMGNIYTVFDSSENTRNYEGAPGLYYRLVELPNWYHHSLFVIINEDHLDEKEFERNYQLNVLTP